MLITKLKTAAAVTILVGALGVAVGTNFLDGQTTRDDPKPTAREGAKPALAQPAREAQAQTPEANKSPPKQPDKLDPRAMELNEIVQQLLKENVELRDVVKSLQKDLKARIAQPVGKTEIRIYSLKNINAEDVSETIMSLFDKVIVNGQWEGPPDPGMAGVGALGGGMGIGGGFGGGQFGQFGGPAGGQIGAAPPGNIGGFGGAIGFAGGVVPGQPMANPPPPPGGNAFPYKLRIATIEKTNTLIIRGNADDLQLIEGLINRLEVLTPPPKDGRPVQPRKKREPDAA